MHHTRKPFVHSSHTHTHTDWAWFCSMFICQWIRLPERNQTGIFRFADKIDLSLLAVKYSTMCTYIAKVSSLRYFDYLTEINIDSSPIRYTNHSHTQCIVCECRVALFLVTKICVANGITSV